MNNTSTTPDAERSTIEPYTLRQFLLYFLRLGTFGFGGPIARAGYMQRDLVERRRWISKQDYVEGLAWRSSRRGSPRNDESDSSRRGNVRPCGRPGMRERER